MVVFRSLLVPLKAVIMNLLSIGAAYGIVVALFQWGWLSDITGVQPAPIEPWIPMMLFAIVFGLSMDYEVFLLSRVREEWHRTGDSRTSVADGLAATAKVITAAAAIMVVVFGSFLLENDRVLKLMGTGLATAILLDATIVRMLLVPATMELLGDRNWWLPRWLDRHPARTSTSRATPSRRSATATTPTASRCSPAAANANRPKPVVPSGRWRRRPAASAPQPYRWGHTSAPGAARPRRHPSCGRRTPCPACSSRRPRRRIHQRGSRGWASDKRVPWPRWQWPCSWWAPSHGPPTATPTASLPL